MTRPPPCPRTRLVKIIDQASGKLLATLGPLTSEVLQVGWLAGPDTSSARLLAGHAAGFNVWQAAPSGQQWRQHLQHQASDVVYSRFAVASSGIVAASCSNKKEVRERTACRGQGLHLSGPGARHSHSAALEDRVGTSLSDPGAYWGRAHRFGLPQNKGSGGAAGCSAAPPCVRER